MKRTNSKRFLNAIDTQGVIRQFKIVITKTSVQWDVLGTAEFRTGKTQPGTFFALYFFFFFK